MINNKEIYKHKIIDGIKLSNSIRNNLIQGLSTLKKSNQNVPSPKLKIIQIGDRQDSKLYIENKIKLCKTVGVESELKCYAENVEKEEILNDIDESNKNKYIHGIIIQLPLPKNLMPHTTEILSKVDISKDVDGLNPISQGLILQNDLSLCMIPPTALGTMELLRLVIVYENNLERYINEHLKLNILKDKKLDLQYTDVTIIGRGLTAGLPVSTLMQRCNATVTLCHSKTKNIAQKCKDSNIIVTAVGKPCLVDKTCVNENSIVIDVGITVADTFTGKRRILGDCAFEEVAQMAKFITPVPGGVGKMTVIMLIKNVIKAWSLINNVELTDKQI